MRRERAISDWKVALDPLGHEWNSHNNDVFNRTGDGVHCESPHPRLVHYQHVARHYRVPCQRFEGWVWGDTKIELNYPYLGMIFDLPHPGEVRVTMEKLLASSGVAEAHGQP